MWTVLNFRKNKVFGDLSSSEGQEMLKPAIAIVYEDPQTVKAMTNNQYQKLMIVCWSVGSYMLYGWHNGMLKPLPLDVDYIESYLQTHDNFTGSL